MPTVRFAPSRGKNILLEVPSGTSLLRAATAAGLPIARACGASRICGRCAVEVRRGDRSLSPEDRRETRTKARNSVAPVMRLACCAEIEGDVEIATPYW